MSVLYARLANIDMNRIYVEYNDVYVRLDNNLSIIMTIIIIIIIIVIIVKLIILAII